MFYKDERVIRAAASVDLLLPEHRSQAVLPLTGGAVVPVTGLTTAAAGVRDNTSRGTWGELSLPSFSK